MQQNEDAQKKITADKKADLLRKLLHMQEYMQLVVIVKENYSDEINALRTSTLPKDKKSARAKLQKKLREDQKNPKIKKLNNATLNTIIEFSELISSDITMTHENFKTEDSIQKWLELIAYNNLKSLDNNLIKLEKKRKISDRWNKVTDAFYVAAQTVTPLAQIPLISVVMNPIVNGLWGFWYASWAISIGYDPALGGKSEPIKSTFNKASYIAGGITTVCTFLGLFPVLWPIVIPIAASALLVSNILWAAGSAIDLYKEITKGKRDTGHHWRIAGHASSCLYITGSIVVAALAIAALLTPVGWAAGAGAIALGVGGALACLAVFGFSKFCHWRAEKKVQAEKEQNITSSQNQSEITLTSDLQSHNTPLQKQQIDKIETTEQKIPQPTILFKFQSPSESNARGKTPEKSDNKPDNKPSGSVKL